MIRKLSLFSFIYYFILPVIKKPFALCVNGLFRFHSNFDFSALLLPKKDDF